jgi:hypothetical protein
MEEDKIQVCSTLIQHKLQHTLLSLTDMPGVDCRKSKSVYKTENKYHPSRLVLLAPRFGGSVILIGSKYQG